MGLFDEIGEELEKPSNVPAVKPTLQKIRFTHDAVIDEIIVNPSIAQGELAARFGYSQTWMSIIINSDAFKERLEARKAELVDPKIKASVEERLEAISLRSLEKIMDRLDRPGDGIKTLELVAIAKLGVGDKNLSRGPQINNSLYVVNLPPTAPDAKTWVKSAQGRVNQEISDARVYD